MAIITKLSMCIDSCTNLLIYDNTLEESDTNLTGWGNNNGINPSNLITATLEITAPDLSVVLIELDVSEFPATVSTEFLLHTFSLSGDGKYKIKYTVTYDGDSLGIVTLTAYNEIFNLCSLKCCVDKLWANIYDIDCGCDNSKYNKAVEATALYKAILNCTGSLLNDTRDKLIKKLQRICNLEKCNCN